MVTYLNVAVPCGIVQHQGGRQLSFDHPFEFVEKLTDFLPFVRSGAVAQPGDAVVFELEGNDEK